MSTYDAAVPANPPTDPRVVTPSADAPTFPAYPLLVDTLHEQAHNANQTRRNAMHVAGSQPPRVIEKRVL